MDIVGFVIDDATFTAVGRKELEDVLADLGRFILECLGFAENKRPIPEPGSKSGM